MREREGACQCCSGQGWLRDGMQERKAGNMQVDAGTQVGKAGRGKARYRTSRGGYGEEKGICMHRRKEGYHYIQDAAAGTLLVSAGDCRPVNTCEGHTAIMRAITVSPIPASSVSLRFSGWLAGWLAGYLLILHPYQNPPPIPTQKMHLVSYCRLYFTSCLLPSLFYALSLSS